MISVPAEREAPSDVTSSIAGEGPKDTFKTVRIAGDEFLMEGSEHDVYFGNLQAFIDGSVKLERYIKSHLQKDAVCLDIGANIGTTTLMLAKHCPDGHVYAFDADPKNIAYLRTNIARNGITNCTVVEMAIGDKPGTLQFHSKGAHGQMMSEAHPYRDAWPSISVEVATIDDFVRDFRRLDFIKMDIEGAEPLALAGARETIAKFTPTIFMEFNSWCLSLLRFDPMTFSRSLWSTFDVLSVDETGQLSPVAGGDPIRFVHDNMALNGCVDDIILKPRFAVPSIEAMTQSAPLHLK
jgi:FkbM family methyltransferase